MNLDIPKMGYFILFKNSGDIFGNGIEKEQLKRGFTAEQSKISHIEVSGGGQWAISANLWKIKVIDITKEHKGRYIYIVKYKDIDYDSHKRYKTAFWAATTCNLGYDFWGVLRFKFNFLMSFKKQFFCSENALWALQKEYPFALNIEPEDCMPAQFFNRKEFDFVWEGEIC